MKLEKKLKEVAVETFEFNTNNDWGFGGAYGIGFVMANGMTVRSQVICYRHSSSERMVKIYDKDSEMIYNEWYTPKLVDGILEILGQKTG